MSDSRALYREGGGAGRVLRPYGVRVYLSARFSAPMEIGGLKTADPLDPAVQAWWKDKVDEIYRADPRFRRLSGQGQSRRPARTAGLRSHPCRWRQYDRRRCSRRIGGIVMWRAFVYPTDQRSRIAPAQAYNEFMPLDGKFRDNVLVQVKNGPIDFQPREPFAPLFGAMPKTPMMLEVQMTKEYSVRHSHLVYLGPLYRGGADAPTPMNTARARPSRGSSTAAYDHHAISGMAGVANIGDDRNWSGSIFNQANWYAFGRLAWDPEISARAVARGMGAHDLRQRSGASSAPVVDDDDGIARSGGGLHDAAGAGCSS